jgi:hypothetical protein
MKHEREFDTSYFHNPYVQGVNYSLFIMLLKEMVSMESKGQPGAAPAVSPSYPRCLQIRMACFVFSASPVPKSPNGGYI